MRALLLVAALLCCLANTSEAAWNSTKLRVGTFAATPLIVLDSSKGNVSISGFSYDLWNIIAQNMSLDYEWVIYPGIAKALAAVSSPTPEIDLAICNIGITSSRELIMDFSQPYLYTGLSIVVYSDKHNNKNSKVDQVMKALFPRLFWECLGVLVLSILVFANLFYIIEKKPKGSSGAVRPSYRRGGFEDSLWWASGVLFTGGGPLDPRTKTGRLLSFLATVFSTILIAIIGSTITAALTVSSLQVTSGIKDVNDLAGLRVGVSNGSTSQIFLQQFGNINLVLYNSSQQLMDVFAARVDNLDAIFTDGKMLENFVKTRGKGFTELVGPSYQPVGYGIAYPLDSPLKKMIDLQVLHLLLNDPDGKFERLQNKYFQYDPIEKTENILDPDDTAIGVTWGLVGVFAFFVLGMFLLRVYEDKKKFGGRDSTSIPTPKEDDVELLHKEIDEALDQLSLKLESLRKANKLASKAKTFNVA